MERFLNLCYNKFMSKVLIVIDVQKFFITEETKPIIENIAKYLKNNFSKYSAIYFTIFKNDSKAPLWKISQWQGCTNSPDTNICDEIKEFSNSTNLFYKNILSAAKILQITQGIKKNNISEVHLCGFDTDCCVLATAYDLFDLGIKPVILENLTCVNIKKQTSQFSYSNDR
jgi:nicotinamidase-related amidase